MIQYIYRFTLESLTQKKKNLDKIFLRFETGINFKSFHNIDIFSVILNHVTAIMTHKKRSKSSPYNSRTKTSRWVRLY